MTPQRKARQGAIFFLLVSALSSHLVATQYFAHQIHYSDQFLGSPLLVDEKMKVKVYAPYAIYRWSYTYKNEGVDDLIYKSLGLLGLGMCGGLLLAGVFWRLGQQRKERTAHGSSRFARPEEIGSWGLPITPVEKLQDKAWLEKMAREGKDPKVEVSSVVVGRDEDGHHYYNSGPEHLLAFAPTRSGKGVSMVIPTLLTWTESVVVADIKGENYRITGWWRSLFSHVIYFNPTDPNSAKFNPLFELRKGESAIPDAMNLAKILGERPKGKDNPFWDGGAEKLLTATILYVLYTQENKTLAHCAQLLMTIDTTLEEMSVCPISDRAVERYVQGTAQATLAKSENVRGGWAAGADGALDLWKDPIIARNTSTSDFRLSEIQDSEHPVSLYLVLPPGDLKRLSPLTKLLFTQMTDSLTRTLDYKHRLLMLLDEFPQLGSMEKIEKAISYTAGYGIKWFFITQGLDQLDDIYGRDNGFLSNCHTRLAFRCNDDKNAARLSKLLGEATGFKEQEGQSGKKGVLASLSNKSISQVEFARPLMTGGELQQLADDRQIIMIAGKYPILGHKITYYNDPFYLPRFKNKLWDFPSSPPTDFPSSHITHDWSNGTLASLPPLPSAAQVEEAQRWKGEDTDLVGGAEPESAFDAKLNASEIEEVSHTITPEMTIAQSKRYLTTRSFTTSDLRGSLELAVKKGLLSKVKMEEVLQGSPALKAHDMASKPPEQEGPPLTQDTSKQAESSFDLNDPFAELLGGESSSAPLTPDTREEDPATPDVPEATPPAPEGVTTTLLTKDLVHHLLQEDLDLHHTRSSSLEEESSS